MERSFRSLSAGVVAGLALISTVAAAQAGRGRGGPPPASPDQPSPAAVQPPRMMAPPGSPAEMLLRQREQLELTDDQATRLTALAKTQKDALKPNRANVLRAQADLADAEDKDNFDAQRSALEKLAKIHIDEDIAHRKAMKDARDVLTQDQRDRMPGMMRGMGPGGRGGMGRGGMGRGGRAGFGGQMGGGRGGMRRGGGRMGMPMGAPAAGLNMRRPMPPVRPPTDSSK